MNQLKQLDQVADRVILLAEASDELRARNRRQIMKAGAAIKEAIERQHKEDQDEISERRAAEAAREAEALAEVHALAKSHGLEVTVKKAAPPKPKPKPRPKKVVAVVEEVPDGVDVVDLTDVQAEDPKVVREWATANGFEVKPRGVIPARVRVAFREATAS